MWCILFFLDVTLLLESNWIFVLWITAVFYHELHLWRVFRVVWFSRAAVGRRLSLLCWDGCEWTLVCISCHLNLEWYSTAACLHTWLSVYDKVLLLLSDALKISTRRSVQKLQWQSRGSLLFILSERWALRLNLGSVSSYSCECLYSAVRFLPSEQVVESYEEHSHIDEYQVSDGVTDSVQGHDGSCQCQTFVLMGLPSCFSSSTAKVADTRAQDY